MMKLVLLLFAASVFAKTTLMVTMNVFSGGADPSWTVSEPDPMLVASIRKAAAPAYRPWPWYRMGYRGFEVVIVESVGRGRPVIRTEHVVYGNSELEFDLAATAPEGTVPNDVFRHMRSHVVGRPLTAPKYDAPETAAANPTCPLPIRGPDNETVWNVNTDNCGYYVSHSSQNNCYNYGTDVVTNTFAQPGRGTGKKWDYNTCEDIRASAERDGLIWVGTEVPKTNPPVGHFISLHIWPNSNFHWVRKDTNLEAHWSHKPGGTPVRETDNNGRKITDPSKCDISPWSVYCGIMLVVPSNITIS